MKTHTMRYYQCVFGGDITENPRVIFPDTESRFFTLSLYEKMCQYNKCIYIDPIEPVPFYLENDGDSCDFNHCLDIDFVVSHRVADIIESIAPSDIQRIPILLNNCIIEHEIINILYCCECVDYEQSAVIHDTKCGSKYPGEIFGFSELVIVPEKAKGHDIFRLSELLNVIIVSQKLRDAFRAINATGLTLLPVTNG